MRRAGLLCRSAILRRFPFRAGQERLAVKTIKSRRLPPGRIGRQGRAHPRAHSRRRSASRWWSKIAPALRIDRTQAGSRGNPEGYTFGLLRHARVNPSLSPTAFAREGLAARHAHRQFAHGIVRPQQRTRISGGDRSGEEATGSIGDRDGASGSRRGQAASSQGPVRISVSRRRHDGDRSAGRPVRSPRLGLRHETPVRRQIMASRKFAKASPQMTGCDRGGARRDGFSTSKVGRVVAPAARAPSKHGACTRRGGGIEDPQSRTSSRAGRTAGKSERARPVRAREIARWAKVVTDNKISGGKARPHQGRDRFPAAHSFHPWEGARRRSRARHAV